MGFGSCFQGLISGNKRYSSWTIGATLLGAAPPRQSSAVTVLASAVGETVAVEELLRVLSSRDEPTEAWMEETFLSRVKIICIQKCPG